MNRIRTSLIKLIQGISSAAQIKGMPRLIVSVKKFLFRKNEIYSVYNDIRIKIDPTVNFHCLNVMNYSGYETIKIFERYLKKGDVYVDIGANLGYMAINAEKIVGQAGAVVALEPDFQILPILKENKRINNASLTVVEKAAAEQTGTAIFNIATESGLSRLDNDQHNLFGLQLFQQKEITTDTLDNILNTVIPGRMVNLIKIDVEGHELQVLKGATTTIQSCRPILILEVNHEALKENNVTYLDLINFLEQFGYGFYFIESHSADWLRFNRTPTFISIKSCREDFIHKPFDLLCIGPNQC